MKGRVNFFMLKLKVEREKRVDVLWEDYILECKLRGQATETLKDKECYFNIFYRFLEPTRISVDMLTQTVLNEFAMERQNSGIKNISVNSNSRVINAFLAWLYKNKHISRPIKIPMLKEQETVKETYSEDALARLLEKPALQTTTFQDYRTWVIINYILGTGNRISSVLSITIADVDLQEGYINLPHTKNKRKQIVPLSSSLVSILKEYMDVRRGENEDYLFCTSFGEKMGRAGAHNALKKYCDNRGVECLGHHAFRHTFAKIAVRDCHIDAFRLQKMLGHADIATTTNYVNLYSDELRNDIDCFTPLEKLLHSQQQSEKIKVKEAIASKMGRKGGRA